MNFNTNLFKIVGMKKKMKESMKNVFPLSFGEEVGNSVSHGVMALLLLFALPYYAIRAYLQAGAFLSFENEKLKYQTLSSESPLFMRILFFLFCQSFLFSV